MEIFRGNFLFASVNAFNFQTLSRRDDLISLCYMLVYLIDGDTPFLLDEEQGVQNPRKVMFDKIKEIKRNLIPEYLCQSKNAMLLLPFVKAVFELTFDEKPDY